eukprot:TRINITY_DN9896_c0_g5_i1.p1 TRINITY_DN9896_c0_g5~~TRINITY_DN9896_c0_g5_i1.p1  ORF type:complete len:146 (-),score=29.75 TRINITY_DN9896_c0_g5_i1:238-675(-)
MWCDSVESSDEGALESVFDQVEEAVSVKLEVEEKNHEWNMPKSSTKRYYLQYIKDEKILLADLSELSGMEVRRSLLCDIYELAGSLQAEELVVSVSLLNPEKDSILRDLIVFGFENVAGDEYTSNGEVATLSMEVNQEYDFVDLV